MSKLTLVHQDDALHLYWHEGHGYYRADWQPVFRKGEVLKQSYQACIDAARARRGAPWIADVSKVAVLDQAAQKWISEWFWPEFVKAGAREDVDEGRGQGHLEERHRGVGLRHARERRGRGHRMAGEARKPLSERTF